MFSTSNRVLSYLLYFSHFHDIRQIVILYSEVKATFVSNQQSASINQQIDRQQQQQQQHLVGTETFWATKDLVVHITWFCARIASVHQSLGLQWDTKIEKCTFVRSPIRVLTWPEQSQRTGIGEFSRKLAGFLGCNGVESW